MTVRDDQAVESVVVTKSVRLVVPFIFVFGLFMMFHGAKSIGGGFQGGVVVASAIVTIAFAFGIDQTGQWLSRPLLSVGTVLGVIVFAVVGVGPSRFDGQFLEITAFPGPKGTLYAVELIEVGIGVTVAATTVILFFEIAGTFDEEGDQG